MDEAFDALAYAPNTSRSTRLIGDLLIKEGHIPDAIAKFTTVAQAYSVRGEPNQATKLLRRDLNSRPMDLAVRTRLIDQLIARGQVNEAISEYLDLADIYYRLAELDMARKTYTTALRVVQQASADRTWNVHILQRMADIDMQRLDWKQAVRSSSRSAPCARMTSAVRKNLVELNLRMGRPDQAGAELDNYLGYLEKNGGPGDAIAFLEDLLLEHKQEPTLLRALAGQYHRAGGPPRPSRNWMRWASPCSARATRREPRLPSTRS